MWRVRVDLGVDSKLALIPPIISLLDINFWGSIRIRLENSLFVVILAEMLHLYPRRRFFWLIPYDGVALPRSF